VSPDDTKSRIREAVRLVRLANARTGRRQMRAEIESRWKVMPAHWHKRNGDCRAACRKPRQPIGQTEFSPVVVHPMNEAEAAMFRHIRNVRRRDRSKGKSPTKWL
jgi:hypothetical protein